MDNGGGYFNKTGGLTIRVLKIDFESDLCDTANNYWSLYDFYLDTINAKTA